MPLPYVHTITSSTQILCRTKLKGTWLYEIPSEILDMIIRINLHNQILYYKYDTFKGLRSHLYFSVEKSFDYKYLNPIDKGRHTLCGEERRGEIIKFGAMDTIGTFIGSSWIDTKLYLYPQGIIDLMKEYPWTTEENFTNFALRLNNFKLVELIAVIVLNINQDIWEYELDAYDNGENPDDYDLEDLYKTIILMLNMNQMTGTPPTDEEMSIGQSIISDAFKKLNDLETSGFIGFLCAFDNQNPDTYEVIWRKSTRVSTPEPADLYIEQQDDYRLNIKGSRFKVRVQKSIANYMWSKEIDKIVAETKQAKRTFKKLLRVMRARRINREMNLYRYSHTDIKQGYHRDIFNWSEIHNHIKKNVIYRPHWEPEGDHHPNSPANKEYFFLPDRARIFQYERFIKLIRDTEAKHEKYFYLLKMGMLCYKYKWCDYEKLQQSIYCRQGKDTGYVSGKVFLTDSKYFQEYSFLGSLYEWERYNNYHLPSYPKYQKNKLVIYDLRHNMWKLSGDITSIFDWEYKELSYYYKRGNGNEKRMIKEIDEEIKWYEEQSNILQDLIHLF